MDRFIHMRSFGTTVLMVRSNVLFAILLFNHLDAMIVARTFPPWQLF